MKIFKIVDHNSWPAHKVKYLLTGKYLYGLTADQIWLFNIPYRIEDNILNIGKFHITYRVEIESENVRKFLTHPLEIMRKFAKYSPLGKFDEEKDLLPLFPL